MTRTFQNTLLFVLLTCAGVVSSSLRAEPVSSRIVHVAVPDFEIAEEKKSEWDWAARGVADLLEIELAARGVVTVDRDMIGAVFAEQRLARSVTGEKAIRTGQLFGASHLARGTVVPVDDSCFRLTVDLVSVETGAGIGPTSAEGRYPEDLNRMVTDLAVALCARLPQAAALKDAAVRALPIRPEALILFYRGLSACSQGRAGLGIAFFQAASRMDGTFSLSRVWESRAYGMAGLPLHAKASAQRHSTALRALPVPGGREGDGSAMTIAVLDPVSVQTESSLADVDVARRLKSLCKQVVGEVSGISLFHPESLTDSVGELDLHLDPAFAGSRLPRFGRWLICDALLFSLVRQDANGGLSLELSLVDMAGDRTQAVTLKDVRVDNLEKHALTALRELLAAAPQQKRSPSSKDGMQALAAVERELSQLPASHRKLGEMLHQRQHGEPRWETHLSLAKAFAGVGCALNGGIEIEMAIDAVDRGQPHPEVDLYTIWRQAGSAWAHVRTEVVERFMDEVLQTHGDSLAAACLLYELARAAHKREKWDEAAELATRSLVVLRPLAAVQTDSAHLNACLAGCLYVHGSSMERLGRKEEAIASLAQAATVPKPCAPGSGRAPLRSPVVALREGDVTIVDGLWAPYLQGVIETELGSLRGEGGADAAQLDPCEEIREMMRNRNDVGKWLSILDHIRRQWEREEPANARVEPPCLREVEACIRCTRRSPIDTMEPALDRLTGAYLKMTGAPLEQLGELPDDDILARLQRVMHFYELSEWAPGRCGHAIADIGMPGRDMMIERGWKHVAPFFNDQISPDLGLRLLRSLPCGTDGFRDSLRHVAGKLPEADGIVLADLWVKAADGYALHGRFEEALSCYRVARQCNPDLEKRGDLARTIHERFADMLSVGACCVERGRVGRMLVSWVAKGSVGAFPAVVF